MKVDIRPLVEADAVTSVVWRNDPQIWRYTGSAPDREISLADEVAWIRRVIADKASLRYAVLADGRHVGNVYLTGIAGGAGEFHIFIGDTAAWGRGVAARATAQMLALARDRLRLERVTLRVHRDNRAALAIYEKMGFAIDGEAGDILAMTLRLAPPD